MAVINLPGDPRPAGVGGALGSIANAFMKKKKEKETDQYILDLIKAKQKAEEDMLAAGKQGEPVDPNIGMTVRAPEGLDIATRVNLVNQVFTKVQPKEKETEELISFFKPPSVKGQVPELVAEQPKGKPRPIGTLTREEISSFLQFPSEGRAPTEKEKEIDAELRTFKDSFLKGVPSQTARDRVLLYKANEEDMQQFIAGSFGTLNKDTGRFEIHQPALVRKANRMERRVKELMYRGEVPDWQTGIDRTFEEFGEEPPQKPPITPPGAAPEKKGALQKLRESLFGGGKAEAAPAQVPAQAPRAATSGTAQPRVTIGAVAGQAIEVPIPTSGEIDAVQLRDYIVQTYRLSPEEATQLIRRYASTQR